MNNEILRQTSSKMVLPALESTCQLILGPSHFMYLYP